jgi:hypothetical protein
MTNRAFKQDVRDRMARTGEKYTKALRAIEEVQAAPSADVYEPTWGEPYYFVDTYDHTPYGPYGNVLAYADKTDDTYEGLLSADGDWEHHRARGHCKTAAPSSLGVYSVRLKDARPRNLDSALAEPRRTVDRDLRVDFADPASHDRSGSYRTNVVACVSREQSKSRVIQMQELQLAVRGTWTDEVGLSINPSSSASATGGITRMDPMGS